MKRYLIHFAIASILFASLIVSVNWIIDPYGIYRTSNQLAQLHKPLLIANERVFKTVRLAKNLADIILLGTSRADLGLGSHYPQFIDKKVINLATYAQSIEESKNLILQYVKQNPENPPDQIFLGLDFFAFNALLDFPSDYDEENFSASRRWQLLLSISSLADVSKYFANHDLLEMNACCDQDGFRYQLSIDQLKSHYRAGFDKYVKGFLTEDKWLAGQECRYSHQNNNGRNTLEVFRALLRMAYDHRINLKLFISPAIS